MIRKFVSTLIAITVAAVSVSAFAACSKKTVSLISVVYDEQAYLDNVSYKDRTDIGEVKIADGVPEIKAELFSRCYNLEMISIPSSVKKIGKQAFSNCDIETVEFRGSLSDWLKIELDAIVSNPLHNGARLYVWENGAIKRVEGDITVPSDVEKIEYGFVGIEGVDTLVIPSNVKSVGDGSFVFSEIKKITVISAATHLSDCAFKDAVALEEVTLPSGTAAIPSNMFFNAQALKKVNLPDSLKTVESWAFCDCYSLEELALPDGTEDIGERAFKGCVKLRRITLGKGIKKIQNSAFACCEALTNIYYKGSAEDWSKVAIADGTMHSYTTVHFNA